MALIWGLMTSLAVWSASDNTPPVKGHAPTIDGVAIAMPIGRPMVGDTLQSYGSPLFNDPDNDPEFGSLLQWYREGSPTPIASGGQYTLVDADIGKNIEFGYTPATDPLSTDPYLGREVRAPATPSIVGRPLVSSTFNSDKMTLTANNSDSAKLTLSLIDNATRPVSGISPRLAFSYSVNSGVTSGALQISQPSETSEGSGVYTATVSGTSVGQITVTPTLDGTTLPTTPAMLQLTLTAPLTILSATTEKNPHTFLTNFPTTGFAGATFKLNLSDNAPTAYQWAVDGQNDGTSYTAVSPNGVVTLKSAHIGTQTVSVKSRATGDTLASWSFTLAGWFASGGSTPIPWANADAYCRANGGALPLRSQVSLGQSVRGSGSLFSEWGDLTQLNAGFILSVYWTGEIYDTAYHYDVVLASGAITYNVSSNVEYVVCRQGL